MLNALNFSWNIAEKHMDDDTKWLFNNVSSSSSCCVCIRIHDACTLIQSDISLQNVSVIQMYGNFKE